MLNEKRCDEFLRLFIIGKIRKHDIILSLRTRRLSPFSLSLADYLTPNISMRSNCPPSILDRSATVRVNGSKTVHFLFLVFQSSGENFTDVFISNIAVNKCLFACISRDFQSSTTD
jgi:hypothetical protein